MSKIRMRQSTAMVLAWCLIGTAVVVWVVG